MIEYLHNEMNIYILQGNVCDPEFQAFCICRAE